MMIAFLLCACGARSGLDEPEPMPDPECTEPSFGVLALDHCDPSSAVDASATFGSASAPLTIRTFGCDGVVVMVGQELHVSTDGGESFHEPRVLPENAILPHLGTPHNHPFAVAEDATFYLLARGGERLVLLRSDDLGETWVASVDVGVGHDEGWGASLLARGDELTVYWLVWGTGTFIARSRDRGESFETPIAVGPGILESSRSHATVCHAGARGTVVSWLDCTTSDCSGEDRSGIAHGRVAVSSGDAFIETEVFELDNGVNRPVVGCGADGRALVGWSSAPYLRQGDLVVATIDECGRTRETLRQESGDRFDAPGSPSFTIGEGGSLVRWHLEWDSGSAVAELDAGGELLGVEIDPDYLGDGEYDLPIASCALPAGGYALLVQTGRASVDPGELLVVRLGPAAAAVDVHVVGVIDDFRAVWLQCDGRGRAHVAWSGVEGASYAAVAL